MNEINISTEWFFLCCAAEVKDLEGCSLSFYLSTIVMPSSWLQQPSCSPVSRAAATHVGELISVLEPWEPLPSHLSCDVTARSWERHCRGRPGPGVWALWALCRLPLHTAHAPEGNCIVAMPSCDSVTIIMSLFMRT